jgi:hypothetical protein
MKKQPSKKAPPKPRSDLKSRRPTYDQWVVFPQAKGRTVELVELIADGDYHCVSIRFRDKTGLTVVIDPALTFKAEFSDLRASEPRVLKRWPTVRSEGL